MMYMYVFFLMKSVGYIVIQKQMDIDLYTKELDDIKNAHLLSYIKQPNIIIQSYIHLGKQTNY